MPRAPELPGGARRARRGRDARSRRRSRRSPSSSASTPRRRRRRCRSRRRRAVVLALVRGDDRLERGKARGGARHGRRGRRPTRRSARRSAPSPGSLGPVGFAGDVVARRGAARRAVRGGREPHRLAPARRRGRPGLRRRASPTSGSRGRATRCPRCGGRLALPDRDRGRPHLQARDTFYSAPLGATYLDETSRERPIVMGSYGIGPGRVMAAAVEQRHDEQRHRLAASRSRRTTSTCSRSRRVRPRSAELASALAEELVRGGSARSARRPRRTPGREVRRRRPARLPVADHGREEDTRGRSSRRPPPAAGRWRIERVPRRL